METTTTPLNVKLPKPTPKIKDDLTVSEVFNLMLNHYSNKLHLTKPQSHGEWASLTIICLLLIIFTVAVVFLYKEYKFRQRQAHLKHY